MLKDISFVVFDIETTGFDPKKEQIIEIGAVKIDYLGNIIDTFSRFIDLYVCEVVPQIITDLTTITTDQLKLEGCDCKEVILDFINFSKDSILVAQNAKFDMSFLTYYKITNLQEVNDLLFLDTIFLAKAIYADKESYNLTNLTKYFEVEYDPNAHHRADYDTLITSKVFVEQLKKLGVSEQTTIDELVKMQKVVYPTEKQLSYYNSLVKKHNLKTSSNYQTKNTISTHIDIIKSIEK